MAVLSWSAAHWFELLQSIGIVFGLLFTAFALRADERLKRVQTLFTVTEHHRDLWTQLYSRPGLARVLELNPNLEKKPITIEERLFVNLLVLHIVAAFRAAESETYTRPEHLTYYVGEILSRPIPRSVWSKLKELQDSDFVQFVEESLRVYEADRKSTR